MRLAELCAHRDRGPNAGGDFLTLPLRNGTEHRVNRSPSVPPKDIFGEAFIDIHGDLTVLIFVPQNLVICGKLSSKGPFMQLPAPEESLAQLPDNN